MARPVLPEDLPQEANQAYGCMAIALGLTALVMVVNLLLGGNPSGVLGLLLTLGTFSGTQALRRRARYGRTLATICGSVLVLIQLGTIVLIVALAATFGALAVILTTLIGLVIVALVVATLVFMFRPSVTAFLEATPAPAR
ncbi:hypothetical protein GCM10009765_36020 [Fodinicola feengrottensis]|uniref:Integral membrane protein n=3 Tax=Fodinicola feengrottensis TaxID=435914 RepID=A0ABN2H8E9_9ACTN